MKNQLQARIEDIGDVVMILESCIQQFLFTEEINRGENFSASDEDHIMPPLEALLELEKIDWRNWPQSSAEANSGCMDKAEQIASDAYFLWAVVDALRQGLGIKLHAEEEIREIRARFEDRCKACEQEMHRLTEKTGIEVFLPNDLDTQMGYCEMSHDYLRKILENARSVIGDVDLCPPQVKVIFLRAINKVNQRLLQ